MVRQFAIAFAFLAGPSWASEAGDIARAFQALMATPDRAAVVQVKGCQVTITERQESTWDDYQSVFTLTQTFHLADLMTQPDAVHLSSRPERDDYGRLSFSVAFEFTDAARSEFMGATRTMLSEQFDNVSMAKVIWSIIAGSEEFMVDEAEQRKARALAGDFGPLAARNWTLEETVEENYRDTYFTIGGPDYLLLYGQEADRLALVEGLHAHKQAHCPAG